MTEEVTFQKISQEDIISEMEKQFAQINAYMLVVKQLKSDAKEAGYDGAILAKVAKARADYKVAELKEKTETLLNLLEEENDE